MVTVSGNSNPTNPTYPTNPTNPTTINSGELTDKNRQFLATFPNSSTSGKSNELRNKHWNISHHTLNVLGPFISFQCLHCVPKKVYLYFSNNSDTN